MVNLVAILVVSLVEYATINQVVVFLENLEFTLLKPSVIGPAGRRGWPAESNGLAGQQGLPDRLAGPQRAAC